MTSGYRPVGRRLGDFFPLLVEFGLVDQILSSPVLSNSGKRNNIYVSIVWEGGGEIEGMTLHSDEKPGRDRREGDGLIDSFLSAIGTVNVVVHVRGWFKNR